MKIKLLVGSLVLLIVMNIAALGAFLLVHTRAPRPPGPWAVGFGADHLRIAGTLNPREREKLFNAMRSFHEETLPLVEDTRALEDELMATMRENPVPHARVDSLLGQISATRLKIARHAADRMIAMGDSLSPDERAHLVDALISMRRGGPPPEGMRRWADDRRR